MIDTYQVKKTLLITVCLIINSTIFSQTSGQTEVVFEPGISNVLGGYTTYVLEKKPQGFRVQICTENGNNARKFANEQKSRFYAKYDGKMAYLEWKEPNFKVRVGDFKNRLEASLYWKQLSVDFPASYVVMDEIKLYKQND